MNAVENQVRELVDADWINKYAINAACEAIQVAAMCQKFLDMEGAK